MMKKLLFLFTLLFTAAVVHSQVVTTASSVTVCTGATTVEIPVKVSSFNAVGSISLRFSYNSTQIHSPSIINLHSSLSAWGTFLSNTATAGTIIISAYDPDVSSNPTGLTLPNNTTLFTLQFTIGTIPSTANVNFVENTQGTWCEYGGPGPNYTPYVDTPQNLYYINGGVTVVADPSLSQPANASICKGGSVVLSTTASNGTGTFAYKWQYSSTAGGTYADVVDGTPTGITYDNETTTNLTISGDGTEATASKYYKCLLTSATPAFGGCDASTAAVTVTTVNDPSISVQPVSPSAVCVGSSLSPLTVTASNGTPSLTYQWYSNTVNSNSGGTSLGSANGAQTNSYTPPTATPGTLYYYCVVSASGSGCNDAVSSTATITVAADPVINTQPISPAAICSGGTTENIVIAASGGTPALGYQWQHYNGTAWVNATNGTPTGASYSGSTGTTFSVAGITTAGDFLYRCVVSATGNGCGDATSNIVTVHVDGTPVAPVLTSATPVSGSVICAGYNTGFATFTSGSGGGTDELEYSTDGGNTWLAYTNNAAISTTGGTTSVRVRARRTGGVCAATGYNIYTIWTYSSEPTAPVLNVATPASGTTVCAGYNAGTVAATAGSGGSTGAADEYRYSIDGQGTWNAYTNGATITTTGATGTIVIQSRRTAGNYGCSSTSWNTLCTWNVASAPVAPALSSANPANGSAVCEGFSTGTVTGGAGSGGSTGAADEFRFSIDDGDTWASYTNGAAINTTGGDGSVIVQSRRTAGNYGCSDSDWSTICSWTINAKRMISGTFNYHHVSGDILLIGADITVNLYKSTDVDHNTLIASDVTDALGYYEFPAICPDCDYDIVATSTHASAGAVNTTDAAQANYWNPHPYEIQKVRFHAGNVAGVELFINGTDAARIQQHFVNGTAFDRAAWTFWRAGAGFTILHNPLVGEPEYTEYYPKVTLAVGSDAVANMYGLVTGDFNRSFNPTLTKAASSTLNLLYAGNLQADANQEVILPLRLVNASSVGAISLILDYPADLAEILDVTVNGEGQLQWGTGNNELRISWHSSTPLEIAENEELVSIRLKTTGAFSQGSSIRFKLATDPLNELADNFFEVINNAMVTVDVIDATALGLDEKASAENVHLNCHPNPAGDFTLISYELPFEGRVELEVYDLLGSRLTMVVNEVQTPGSHLVKFNTFDIPDGLYLVKLRLKSSTEELIRTIKLIRNH